ncbi:nuclear polyadenylated RNA-binding protein 3 [Neocucurbitaria cava]|uniref:Nuclear polyadenylated RNA-binding protein 3 n=1 Tax=Neocucurbitaria cava TaxID=798079 RepID=A0A9W8Y278_9PLEO|nr:nuclear polyadenylated RNA-binding protein 3 [Neocucurbitaria cava]
MIPGPSPPQEAEHVRHQQLTPESPRPQNVPSPANIPLLVEQMDLNFNGSTNNSNGNSSSASQYPPQSQTPSALHSTPYYADQSSTSSYQNVGIQGGAGSASAGFSQSAASGGSMGTQAQDTPSIQSFTPQQQSRAASASDATHASGQDPHSAYPYSHDNAYAAQLAPPQSVPGAHYQTEAHAGASVDVQALLDSLTPAANNAPSGQYASPMSAQSVQSQPNASASSLPATSNLPPRPPAQDKPVTHPNYNPNDDIRSFHPHSQRAPNTQQRGNGQLPPLNMQRQDFAAGSRPPAQSPTTPGQAQRQPGQRSETPDDEDIRWPPEVNRKYEEFLDQERKFVTEGQWDQFPMGSRLFIGNLPTEKVTKRDIFHRFYRHGQLAQISIKQAYGFVQFLDSESCRRALDAEQGQAVRGRKMRKETIALIFFYALLTWADLEISKPQRNTKAKPEPQNTGARRRSRSPDYTRGGTGPPPRDGRYGANPMSPRDRERRFRDRDDYRPMRSPSPRGPRGIRSRDRSRDRDFIRYVEDAFRSQNLRSNVLILSGRFPEPAVVRRQILEGVLAIVRLDTTGLSKGKVSVQIFDRRGGANNVQFNEYADLDPTTAGLLVSNAKQTQSQPVQPVQPPAPSYSFPMPNLPQFSQPAANTFSAAPTSQPNVSNLITSLDPASLSQLLSAMSGNNIPQNPQPAPTPGFNADLARLLAQVPSPAQTPGAGSAQPNLASLGNQFPGLASFFASQGQQTAPSVQSVPTPTQAGSAPDMNEIMAQLAQYQR